MGARALLVALLAGAAAAQAPGPAGSETMRAVASPQQFEAAVRAGTRHIVVTEHMDLTRLAAARDSALDDAVLALQPGTATIRGNCTGRAPASVTPPLSQARQCVVTVRGDFLDASNAPLLVLEALYIRIADTDSAQAAREPGAAPSALLVKAPDELYLLDVVMKGAAGAVRSRGVEVEAAGALFAAGCTFTGFSQQVGAGVLLAERARGTFSRCAFSDNVGTPAPPAAAAAAPGRGPALGLRGGSEAASYSAAWLAGCSFERNAGEVRGAASAENARCRVFSDDAAAPEVFIEALSRTEKPWWLVDAGGAANTTSAAGRPGGFSSVDFPRGESPALTRALADAQAATGLPRRPVDTLPPQASLRAVEPQVVSVLSKRATSRDSRGRRIALIVGCGVLGVVLLAALLAAIYCCRRGPRVRRGESDSGLSAAEGVRGKSSEAHSADAPLYSARSGGVSGSTGSYSPAGGHGWALHVSSGTASAGEAPRGSPVPALGGSASGLRTALSGGAASPHGDWAFSSPRLEAQRQRRPLSADARWGAPPRLPRGHSEGAAWPPRSLPRTGSGGGVPAWPPHSGGGGGGSGLVHGVAVPGGKITIGKQASLPTPTSLRNPAYLHHPAPPPPPLLDNSGGTASPLAKAPSPRRALRYAAAAPLSLEDVGAARDSDFCMPPPPALLRSAEAPMETATADSMLSAHHVNPAYAIGASRSATSSASATPRAATADAPPVPLAPSPPPRELPTATSGADSRSAAERAGSSGSSPAWRSASAHRSPSLRAAAAAERDTPRPPSDAPPTSYEPPPASPPPPPPAADDDDDGGFVAGGSSAYQPPRAPRLMYASIESTTPVTPADRPFTVSQALDPTGRGLSGACLATTSTMGLSTMQGWSCHLGTSGQLQTLGESLTGQSGPVFRHRYEAGDAPDPQHSFASADDVLMAAAELSDALYDVAAAGAVFRGRYLLDTGRGARVQRAGRHGVVHFAERAPPAPSGGGRAAAIPPPNSATSHDPSAADAPPGAPGAAYAIKFYTNRAAFDAARALYGAEATRPCMGAVRDMFQNARRKSTAGHVLPPCVVSRRGESLAAWARRVKPSRPIALQALAAIADALAALHARGHVYFACKATDVVWLEASQEWQLSDFGAAMKIGSRASPMAIMQAASPEVLAAAESDTPVVVADTATDVWALGVVAYELLTASHVFPAGTPQATIRGAIFGTHPMPWEERHPSRLTRAEASIVPCFARDPAKRPLAVALAAEWRELVAYGGADSTGVIDSQAVVSESSTSCSESGTCRSSAAASSAAVREGSAGALAAAARSGSRGLRARDARERGAVAAAAARRGSNQRLNA